MNSTFALLDTLLTGGVTNSTLGVSGESAVIDRAWENARVHYSFPVTREPLASRFAGLAETWRSETTVESSFSELVMNSAYQRIIGLGPQVLPNILDELKHRPDHWFWALSSITGVDPIPEEAAGNLRLMTEAWLNWGRTEGLVA